MSRISEEIKSKSEYGSSNKKIEEEGRKEEEVNKKIVKFFSGKTEAVTECIRCENKNTRV